MGIEKETGVLKGYTEEELKKGVLILDRSFEESDYKPKNREDKKTKKV